jgi:hypothetical protein
MAYWSLNMVNLAELMGPLADWLTAMIPKLRSLRGTATGVRACFSTW